MRKLLLKSDFFQKHACILLLVCFSFTVFQIPKLFAETVEEGAKREGKVVFYTTLTLPDIQALANDFQKKYPFLKLEYTRANESKLLERLIAEKRGGKALADVLHMAGTWTNVYKKEGFLRKYVSAESKLIPQGFKDPEGFWTTYYTTCFTFIYNTRLVAKNDLPKNYEDLLNARWKKKIGISRDEIEWYIGMLDFLGEEKCKQFIKLLGNQDPIVRDGRTLITYLLVAGEFPLALGNASLMFVLQKEGAPIDRIPFSTPTLAGMRCIGIHANAPHPNAARLLEDYILSKECQNFLNRVNRPPVRSDIQLEPALAAITRSLYPIRPKDPELLQSYRKEFEALLLKR